MKRYSMNKTSWLAAGVATMFVAPYMYRIARKLFLWKVAQLSTKRTDSGTMGVRAALDCRAIPLVICCAFAELKMTSRTKTYATGFSIADGRDE